MGEWMCSSMHSEFFRWMEASGRLDNWATKARMEKFSSSH